MNNLFHAELYRYKHSLLFWCAVGAAIAAGTVYGLDVVNNGTFDDMFVVPLFVVLATFFSLSIGREYSDGTIRNKIIAGKSKTVIYLSRIYISLTVTTVLVLLFLLPFVAITFIPVLSEIPTKLLLWIVLGFLLVNFVWSILFTVVSTLISSREIASILNFVLIIVIMFAAYQVEHMIGQSQYFDFSTESTVPMTPDEIEQVLNNTYNNSYSASYENGTMTYYKIELTDDNPMLNPSYVEEPFRTMLVHIENLLPHGQINAYVSHLTSLLYEDSTSEYDTYIKVYPLYSLIVLAILIAAGLLVFRKKDLK
ncbi:ABC transporter permease subunit [Lysinibacillus agricola]|uniref:ABC transporter permease subunit n=1 Tax=Lysinibacillus agricola TaxID=2590012 RepID=UPI003C1B7EAE